MSDTLYLVICGLLTAGILAGISLMSRVRTAAAGNQLSSISTALAVLATLWKYGLLADWALWLSLAVGLGIGLVAALRVKMIQMPQAVALLNGFGGLASALVAAVALLDGGTLTSFALAAAGLALLIGMITTTGSLVAAGKLQKILPQKPLIWPAHQVIMAVSLSLSVLSWIALAAGWLPAAAGVPACVFLSGFFGLAFAIRVGGADMPITISLLNSLSGVAGAIAGMAVNDPLLVAVGGVVGASGLLLTQIMCRAMNRSLIDILTGRTTGHGSPAAAASLTAAAKSADRPAGGQTDPAAEDSPAAPVSPAELLRAARSVIIIPGYGMALAQAQGLVKQLADKLESCGSSVKYAIHPVAGRMPGHMNVLLSEVDIPYDNLYEMDDINPSFADCDVALVIGANDVINPAANTAEGTPIYGMPILSVEKARQIIICNVDLKPGYAGVPNPLYTKKRGVTLLLGDAAQTLAGLIAALD